MNKSVSGQPQPSRQTVLSWIHNLFNDIPLSFRIQQLGKGVIYCRIINHYFSGVILISRIIWHPKTEYENTLNLRIFQNALAQLKISIPIDPIRLSKERLPDNWAFVVSLYKYLTPQQDQFIPPTHQQQIKPAFFGHMIPNMMMGPKRSLEHLYPDFYTGVARQPLQPYFNGENYPGKNIYNASKYSVGKLYKQNTTASMATGGSSPNKGKWSVNSHMFQNNLVPIIDRIKEILLKSSHDVQKIRQVKMLLNLPQDDVVVKVEDDQNQQIIKVTALERFNDRQKEKEEIIETKADIQLNQ